MNSENSLKISFRKKIPFLNDTLSIIMGVLFAVLCILYFIMVPANNASPEMRVGYYILVVPEGLKTASGWSVIGIMVLWPIYASLKRIQPGVLILNTDQLRIIHSGKERIIPVTTVTRITVNDMTHISGRLRNKTEVIIHMTSAESVSFVLANYAESDLLVKLLGHYTDIEFAVFTNWALNDHDNG